MTGTEIIPKVRQRVYERDSWDGAPCCIRCGRPYPEVHHYIERSRGGLGIEENLVCLCTWCHKDLHNKNYREMTDFVRDYLKNYYEDWDEKKLIRRKYEQGHFNRSDNE